MNYELPGKMCELWRIFVVKTKLMRQAILDQLRGKSPFSKLSSQLQNFELLPQDDDHPISTSRQIGQGQCGTIFALPGSQYVIKVANSPKGDTELIIDCEIHDLVYQRVRTLKDINISVPEWHAWIPARSALNLDNLPRRQNACEFGIVSERVPLVPSLTRHALIHALCPRKLQAQALLNNANRDCMIRVYLGRLSDHRAKHSFSLRNVPLYLDDMLRLGLDVDACARTMGVTLAFLHWSIGIDGRDIEFVMAPKSKLQGRRSDSARYAHLWLLDFNECSYLLHRDIETRLKMLVDAFSFNDPYYPRPDNTDDARDRVWKAFRDEYVQSADQLQHQDEAVQFVTAIENNLKSLSAFERV